MSHGKQHTEETEPMYQPRTRRHHRAAVLFARRNPDLVTARAFLDRLGFGDDFAERYAAQITRTAKRIGLCPAHRTWTTRNGKARSAAAYDLRTQAFDLVVAALTYKRTALAFGLAA
ncbi:hypothetical protein AB0M39_41975 [Streptomyces sp. NPDC051907]|uniref:hypothetical protein n=1 Tax=Streptomyces sp. NPDC051907 TaxID=3155284 RepID=UPI00341D9F09